MEGGGTSVMDFKIAFRMWTFSAEASTQSRLILRPSAQGAGKTDPRAAQSQQPCPSFLTRATQGSWQHLALELPVIIKLPTVCHSVQVLSNTVTYSQ